MGMFGKFGMLGGHRVIEFLDLIHLDGGPVVLDLTDLDLIEVGFYVKANNTVVFDWSRREALVTHILR